MSGKHENNTVGALGEQVGCTYLKQKGYSILDTNYKNDTGVRLGEIDIIAEKSGTIYFVEVKTRVDFGENTPLPEQNITKDKLQKLQKIAWHFLRSRRITDRPYTFDALSILLNIAERKAKIRHLEGIFL